MQQSGGRAGRPLGHTSIEQLEATVAKADHDRLELVTVLGELGFRNSKRAYELKSLVQRLLRNLEIESPARFEALP